MNSKLLGYSRKWLEYGILDQKELKIQIKEFEESDDKNTEHYRYGTFINWLQKKDSLTLREIKNYIELAKDDEIETMGGSAIKELFKSPILNEEQYEYIKSRLPEFGKWTKKLISREDLLKEILYKKITFDLFLKCWEHKKKFKENWLIEVILDKTENTEILEFIINSSISKKIKNHAQNKLLNYE